MDIFTPIVEKNKLHPHFLRIIQEPDIFAKEVLLEWANGFVDRDNKFVLEFQTTFNSSFWELYLFACLKKLNLNVDFSYSSPDFVVKKHFFNVEATTANNAIDLPPEWDEEVKRKILFDHEANLDLQIVANLATIRLANALVSKYKKYKNSYSNLKQVKDKPFVIAIAPFEQPFFYYQSIQAITRVLYACDLTCEGIKYLDFIEKPNGSKINLGYFANTQMREISAVIFTNTATFGKVRALSKDSNFIWFQVHRYNEKGIPPIPEVFEKRDYHETLLDGLHIFHNPYADVPLDHETFNQPEVVQHIFDIERRMPMDNAKEGALIMRTLIRLTTKPNK
jgi:hypothetical protein